MDERDLLQPLYLASGALLLVGYGPQLRQLAAHPEAGVKACPLSSWLTWTGCRVVALLYSACVVRDAALTLIVGLDVGARMAVLLMLARAHALQRPAPGLAPGARWRLLGLAATLLLPLLMGCRSASDRVPPAAPVRIVVPDDSNVAWLQRHVLNLILLPLMDDGREPRWREPGEAFECLGPLQVRVDGRPLVAGERVPADAYVLEWNGDRCALAWGGPLPLSGRARLRVVPSARVLVAEIRPEGLVLPVDGRPVRLTDRFVTQTAIGAPDGG